MKFFAPLLILLAEGVQTMPSVAAADRINCNSELKQHADHNDGLISNLFKKMTKKPYESTLACVAADFPDKVCATREGQDEMLFVTDVLPSSFLSEIKVVSRPSAGASSGKYYGQAAVHLTFAMYLQSLALSKQQHGDVISLLNLNTANHNSQAAGQGLSHHILPLTFLTETSRSHVDRHRAGTGPIVDDADRVAFVMLNTNPDAHFDIEDSCIPVVENTMVAFRGGHSAHRTVVRSGKVELLGPFHAKTLTQVGDAPPPTPLPPTPTPPTPPPPTPTPPTPTPPTPPPPTPTPPTTPVSKASKNGKAGSKASRKSPPPTKPPTPRPTRPLTPRPTRTRRPTRRP